MTWQDLHTPCSIDTIFCLSRFNHKQSSLIMVTPVLWLILRILDGITLAFEHFIPRSFIGEECLSFSSAMVTDEGVSGA